MDNLEEAKNLIQEWFASCQDAEEVTNLYAEILHETRNQMKYMLNGYIQKRD